jgi:hypothetical protein
LPQTVVEPVPTEQFGHLERHNTAIPAVGSKRPGRYQAADSQLDAVVDLR